MKTNASPVLITVALVWFTVIQNTQAVSPAANRRIECACGDVNTATGAGALHNNTIGSRNTASGVNALPDNYIGNNTADGTTALFLNTTGSNNTASGDSALFNNTTGINNAAFGAGAGSGITMVDNVICIGANVAGADVSNVCFIGNIRKAACSQVVSAPSSTVGASS